MSDFIIDTVNKGVYSNFNLLNLYQMVKNVENLKTRRPFIITL